jgi:hypothetical protein
MRHDLLECPIIDLTSTSLTVPPYARLLRAEVLGQHLHDVRWLGAIVLRHRQQRDLRHRVGVLGPRHRDEHGRHVRGVRRHRSALLSGWRRTWGRRQRRDRLHDTAGVRARGLRERLRRLWRRWPALLRHGRRRNVRHRARLLGAEPRQRDTGSLRDGKRDRRRHARRAAGRVAVNHVSSQLS